MVVNKRKKSRRKIGSNTYGWGKNKHRNSGSRGGAGMAGTGKKAHGKKTMVWKEDYLGKHGFVMKGAVSEETCISLRDLEDKLPTWIAQKKASDKEVDLGALGYTKLLSTGKAHKKIKITVKKATAGAAQKIKEAGGELVVKQ